MSTSEILLQMQSRLARLEAEQAIHACMNRYMVLCDQLGVDSPLDELVALFAADAIWEGVGNKYATTFGRLSGRSEIRAMFAKYMVEPAHFALNVHFLTSELIRLDGDDAATGSWVMLQTSTFNNGSSHLNAARLTVDFRWLEGAWRMSHFRTENLFSRPVDHWSAADMLHVPK
jgi:hypothetical protein